MKRSLAALALPLALAGCAVPAVQFSNARGGEVAILQRGIHTELMLPRAMVEQGLPAIAQRHPQGRFFAFGFGKDGVVGQNPPSILAILASGLPGPAVVEVTSLAILPAEAIGLPLPEAGRAPLLAFLHDAMAVCRSWRCRGRPARC